MVALLLLPWLVVVAAEVPMACLTPSCNAWYVKCVKRTVRTVGGLVLLAASFGGDGAAAPPLGDCPFSDRPPIAEG